MNNRIRREMNKYTLSKTSIIGIVILILGLVFTIQGIFIRYHLSHVKASYQQTEIKNGRFIERDITREELIGSYYTENNGTVKYGPYCCENGYTAKRIYIVAVNENPKYYAPLVLSRKYQKDFQQMINENTSYHILGKFEKYNSVMPYSPIAECPGIDNPTGTDQLMSARYQIKIIDLQAEKKVLYKGLSLFIFGLLILVVTVKREK
ncbi:hypothetical protein D7V83_07950 [bacterium 0.1xD8-71]|nr:hypothetical protein D7V83_07950 [bacterium 0.1xD8-71]